jgi:hypothetical protein
MMASRVLGAEVHEGDRMPGLTPRAHPVPLLMPLRTGYLPLARLMVLLTFGAVSLALPPTLRAGSFWDRLRRNARALSELPALQRPAGLLQELAWLWNGPVQPPPGLRAEAEGTQAAAITTVQLIGEGADLRIHGVIRRGSFGEGSGRLEVGFLDKTRRVLGSRTASYLPNPIPPNYRGGIGRSFFSVRLERVPEGLAVVRVRWRDADGRRRDPSRTGPLPDSLTNPTLKSCPCVARGCPKPPGKPREAHPPLRMRGSHPSNAAA